MIHPWGSSLPQHPRNSVMVAMAVFGQAPYNRRVVSCPSRIQSGSGLRMDRGTKSSGIVHAAFVAGSTGKWKVERMDAIRGPPLATAGRLQVSLGARLPREHAAWILSGVTSHERYATRVEHDRLVAVQPPLDRAEA